MRPALYVVYLQEIGAGRISVGLTWYFEEHYWGISNLRHAHTHLEIIEGTANVAGST